MTADGRVWLLAGLVAYVVLAFCAAFIPLLWPESFVRWLNGRHHDG